jgi:hypothetical protein
MAYLTAAALRLVLPDAGTVADATADDDALDAIIARASQVVDGYCGRTWTVATTAADRIFYGTGTPKLRLDWTDDTIASGDVTLPTGWTLPEFVEVRNAAADYLALQIVDADGFKLPSTVDYAPYIWTEGIPVTINAAWGYAAIPGDVVEVTAIIATARWRETYVGALENWQGDVGRNYEIPPNAREILDRLRLASTFTVGGLF